MELKKDFLKLLKDDMDFRNEVKYLLEIDELEKEMDELKEKI